jgi:hypothetical protein
LSPTKQEKENNMQITALHAFDIDELPDIRPPKPRNTRTKKTAWKERRRLANAPKSIQKRVLKRV